MLNHDFDQSTLVTVFSILYVRIDEKKAVSERGFLCVHCHAKAMGDELSNEKYMV